MNVKDVCLKKNTVRRKRMYVCPVKPVIENDSKKELQQQNANEMHQTMKNCKMHKSARVCHLHGENLPQHRRLSATSPAPLPPKSSAGNPTDRARRY